MVVAVSACKPRGSSQPGRVPAAEETAGKAITAAEQAIADAALPIEKQRDIWDVEHLTFELETRFGKPFVQAIKDRDSTRLEAHLSADFAAVLQDSGNTTVREHGPITEQRQRQTEGASLPADRVQFVAWLLGEGTEIDRIQRARLRVLKLRQEEDETDIWEARVLLSVFGTSAENSVIVESEHAVSFRILDHDKIEDEPIVRRWEVLSQSRRQSQQALLEEVTEQAGLAQLPLPDNWRLEKSLVQQYWSQMAVEDFDNDGYLDIAIGTYIGRPLLLHSERGQRFRDITQEAGISGWPLNNNRLIDLAIWIDFDNDGYVDLLMGDRVYHNLAGQRFEDVTAKSGLVFDHNPMGGLVADYDCDGLLDLYVLYQDPMKGDFDQDPMEGDFDQATQPWVGDTKSGAENQLWRNEGGGRFRNVTSTAKAGGGLRKSFAATWHFYDDDRFPDLYIANDFGNNVHLRNRGDGTFEDISSITGMTDFATSMGVASGDIDNDGSPEFYVANMYSKMGRRIIDHVTKEDYPPGIFEQIQGSCAGNRLYRRGDDNTFHDISDQVGVNGVGWAYAPVMEDMDGDGWLDTYATTGFLSFDRGKPDG